MSILYLNKKDSCRLIENSIKFSRPCIIESTNEMCINNLVIDILNKNYNCNINNIHEDNLYFKSINIKTTFAETVEICNWLSNSSITKVKNIVIIHKIEELNHKIINCLLKPLEEINKYSAIIIITNNFSNIKPTILSRCYKIHVMSDININEEVLENYFLNIYLKQLSEYIPVNEIDNFYQKIIFSLLNDIISQEILYSPNNNIVNIAFIFANIILYKSMLYKSKLTKRIDYTSDIEKQYINNICNKNSIDSLYKRILYINNIFSKFETLYLNKIHVVINIINCLKI